MVLPESFTPLWSVPTSGGGGGWWFVFAGGKLLISYVARQTDAATVPKGERPPVPIDAAFRIGLLGEVSCWAAWARSETAPPGFSFDPLRRLFDRLPDELVAVAGRAIQILEFDRTHRYCGACAAATDVSDVGRARRCTACGEVFYPRISPAMMVLVTRQGPGGSELLLATGSRFATRVYSALAGFVEPSESLEDCVRREVHEEVGVRIGALRYFDSQCWPFPHSLMVAFLAEYAEGEIKCQEGEIVDAQWFPVDRLPALPHRLSVARRLIDYAVERAARG